MRRFGVLSKRFNAVLRRSRGGSLVVEFEQAGPVVDFPDLSRQLGNSLPTKSDIRARLRRSTAEIHERLHNHAGLAAAAAGTIELDDYCRLLSRLWGFHRAFESAYRLFDRRPNLYVQFEARARSFMLESDLVALGVDSASVAELPQCRSLFAPANAAEFMGALYVVEGSTLGGIQLARALEPLMEPYSGAGRSFFLGYGDRHGPMWRSFLIKLEGCASSNADEEALIGGAMRTFLDFETWMAGWRADPTAETSPPPISGRSEMVADQ